MKVKEVVTSIKRFIFEKFYGAFVWVLFCAMLDSAWMLIDAYIPFEVWGMKYVEDFFLISASVAVVGAIGYSLWTGRIGRAFGQIFLSFVMVIALFIAMLCVGAYTSPIAMKNRGPDKGWWSVGPNRAIPFSVEYRSAHGFLAEYERRITFSSGRHVNLQTDTGGAGAFAVFELAPNVFYLVDGLEHDFVRCEYRVDAGKETVEQRDGDCEWVRIVDGSQGLGDDPSWFTRADEFLGKAAAGKMSQAGVELSHRRYLGKICPSGKFEQGGIEPDVADEGDWISSGFTQEIPFAYEWNKAERSRRNSRIAFSSGKKIGLMWNDKTPQDVYKMKDGSFLLIDVKRRGGPQLHRIDIAKEAVYFAGDDHWVRVPDGAIGIRAVIEEEAKEGRPAQSVMTAYTENGRVGSVGSELVGKPLRDGTYVGTLYPNGTIARRK